MGAQTGGAGDLSGDPGAGSLLCSFPGPLNTNSPTAALGPKAKEAQQSF